MIEDRWSAIHNIFLFGKRMDYDLDLDTAVPIDRMILGLEKV